VTSVEVTKHAEGQISRESIPYHFGTTIFMIACNIAMFHPGLLGNKFFGDTFSTFHSSIVIWSKSDDEAGEELLTI
jgi:hypothetical protein